MGWSSRGLPTALTVGATLAIASCGGATATPPERAHRSTQPAPATTLAVPPPVVETTYRTDVPADEEEGESVPARYDVLSAGRRLVRVDLQTYHDVEMTDPDEHVTYTFDGVRLLTYDSGRDPLYMRYDAPREHPDTWSEVADWLSPPPAPMPGRSCTRLPAQRSLHGRAAVGYTCRYDATDDSEAWTDEEWVDRATGAVLQQPYLKLERLVVNPHVDATTFATQPPAGVPLTVVAGRTPPPGQQRRVPAFTLDRLGGGRVASTDLVGRPFVLAFYSADFAFDESGTSVASVIALQQLTHGGSSPTVVGVQVGERLVKPGVPPLKPRGVSVPIGYDDKAVLQHSLGLNAQLGFAFVRSDGTVAATYDRAPTHAELQRSLAGLR